MLLQTTTLSHIKKYSCHTTTTHNEPTIRTAFTNDMMSTVLFHSSICVASHTSIRFFVACISRKTPEDILAQA